MIIPTIFCDAIFRMQFHELVDYTTSFFIGTSVRHVISQLSNLSIYKFNYIRPPKTKYSVYIIIYISPLTF